MAKKLTFTTAEKQEALRLIKLRLAGTGWMLKRLNAKSADKQLAHAEKALRKWAKRNKAGEIDWAVFFDNLLKFFTKLIELLGPLLVT